MSQYLCPICQADSNTVDTRPYHSRLRRRRKCKNGHRFSTLEVPADVIERLDSLLEWMMEQQPDPDVFEYIKRQTRRIILKPKGDDDDDNDS